MTQNLAHTWLLVTWIILTSGKRFLSPVYLSAPIGSSRTSLPTMILGVGLMAGASAGPLRRGVCDSKRDLVMLFRVVVLIGSDRRPKGDRLSRVLDEELSSLKADRSRGVLGPETPGHEGTPDTLPNLGRSR